MQTEAPTVRYLLPCHQFVCSRSWRETIMQLHNIDRRAAHDWIREAAG